MAGRILAAKAAGAAICKIGSAAIGGTAIATTTRRSHRVARHPRTYLATIFGGMFTVGGRGRQMSVGNPTSSPIGAVATAFCHAGSKLKVRSREGT